MSKTVLKLAAGTYRLDKPMQIGSMRVVGARNFVILSAVATLYRKALNLFVANRLKQDIAAPTAEVIHISISRDLGICRAGKDCSAH